MPDVILVETVAPHYKIDWSIVNDDSIFVDAGFTEGDVYNCIRKRSKGLYIGIEPNPNFKINEEDNLKISRKALVGNSQEDKMIFYSNNTASSIVKELYGGSIPIKVEPLRIKDLFTEFNIDHIDWLKLNVVGAEWEIMRDMTQDMAGRIKQICVQNYFLQLKDDGLPSRMNDRLKELGFKTNFSESGIGTIIYGMR